MAIKIKKARLALPKASRLLNRADDKSFDDVIVLPPQSSPATENMLQITDIQFDPKTLRSTGIYTAEGHISFSLKFYTDSEQAIQANARRLGIKVYKSDPRPKIMNVASDSTLTVTGYNQEYTKAASFNVTTGRSSDSEIVADRISKKPLAAFITKKIPPRDVIDPQPGLIKEMEVPLGITDTHVVLYNNWKEGLLSELAPTFKVPPPLPSQKWSSLTTPGLDIDNPTVNRFSKVVDNRINNRGQEAIASQDNATDKMTSPARDRRRALSEGYEPGQVYNAFYAGTPTSEPAGTNPVAYAEERPDNEVIVHKVGYKNNSSLTVSSSKVGKATQKPLTDIKKNTALNRLYRANYDARNNRNDVSAEYTVQESSFESNMLEHRVEFEIDLRELPILTREIFLRLSTIGKDSEEIDHRYIRINFRKHVDPYLTPQSPPRIEILDYELGHARVQVTQEDPLATTTEVWRATTDVENLQDAEWTRVIRQDHTIDFPVIEVEDKTLVGNVEPKVTVYEARCFGPSGVPCPTVFSQVRKGVMKRVSGPSKGECTIVPTQIGASIEIAVRNIPEGVAGVILRKQEMDSSLSTPRTQAHLAVKEKETGKTYVPLLGDDRESLTFLDLQVSDRRAYRYYAQFDWIDVGRRNSSSDAIIKYVRQPKKMINLYVSNATIEKANNSSELSISFDYSASFTEEGLEQLNVALGSTGISSIFIEELKKDRSITSDFLSVTISRENKKTGYIATWPIDYTAKGAVDDNINNADNLENGIPPLQPDTDYIYRLRVHLINPEAFFTEALTKIPSSTKQIILDGNPEFVEVSARRFAENFGREPGVMPSPSTINNIDYDKEVKGAYTGIESVKVINTPSLESQVDNVTATRVANVGRPYNLVRWEVTGDTSSIYEFRLAANVGNEEGYPLAKVSARSSAADGVYEFRDELLVREIVPISYTVSIVYNNQEESARVTSDPIHAKSNKPKQILDRALKLQKRYTPLYPYTDVAGGTSRLQSDSDKIAATNILLKGAKLKNKL